MKLVLIEWLDSAIAGAWTRDEPDPEPVLCQSVGWLVQDGKKVKTLAPHMTVEEEAQRAGSMTIPVCCITRIVTLKRCDQK